MTNILAFGGLHIASIPPLPPHNRLIRIMSKLSSELLHSTLFVFRV